MNFPKKVVADDQAFNTDVRKDCIIKSEGAIGMWVKQSVNICKYCCKYSSISVWWTSNIVIVVRTSCE
jgi:hypothetical protein